MRTDIQEARDAYRRHFAAVRGRRWALAIMTTSILAAVVFLFTATAWAVIAVIVMGIIVGGAIHWLSMRRPPLSTPFDDID